MLHVPRFFVNEILQTGKTLILGEDNHHHVRNVLRLKVGEKSLFFNGKDGEFEGFLERCERHESRFICGAQTRVQSDDAETCLIVGILKADMMALLVEKATELRVTRIIPFTSSGSGEHCKVGKLRLRAIKASQQCERLSVPEISEVIDLQDIGSHVGLDWQIYAAIERGNFPHLPKILSSDRRRALLVGAAGGFSDSEIEVISSFVNVSCVSLGASLLRSETACFVGLSLFYALQ